MEMPRNILGCVFADAVAEGRRDWRRIDVTLLQLLLPPDAFALRARCAAVRAGHRGQRALGPARHVAKADPRDRRARAVQERQPAARRQPLVAERLLRGTHDPEEFDARPPALSRRPCRQPAAADGACARRFATTSPARSTTPDSPRSRINASAKPSRMQEEVGLEVVTDGEFRRASYWARFVERSTASRSGPRCSISATIRATKSRSPRPRGTQMRRTQPLARRRVRVPARRANATPKVTLPAPSTMHFYGCTDFAASGLPDASRSSPISAAIFRDEIAAWSRPAAATCSSTRWRSRCCATRRSAQKVKARAQIPTSWSIATSASTNAGGRRARPPTWRSASTCAAATSRATISAAGGYESVAERFFSGTRVNHFLLEYDTERAGDFAPLRFVRRTRASCSA